MAPLTCFDFPFYRTDIRFLEKINNNINKIFPPSCFEDNSPEPVLTFTEFGMDNFLYPAVI